MTDTLILPESDPRVGAFRPDGSFERWPATDIDGGRFERVNAIVKRVGQHFVVLPPLKGEVDVKIGDAAQMMTEPPDGEPDVRRKRG